MTNTKFGAIQRFFIYCLALAAFATTMAIFPYPFENIENRIYDYKLRKLGNEALNPEIIHLDIDDKSIKEFGSWPWDRSLSARLINKLWQFGARLVVFDILYSTRGRSEEGDNLFFQAIGDSRIVVSSVGFSATADEGSQLSLGIDKTLANALYDRAWNIPISKDTYLLKINRLNHSHVPLQPILLNSIGVGHIKSSADSDGVHRSVPLLIRLEDKVVPSLSLAAWIAAKNIPLRAVSVRGDGILIQNEGNVYFIPCDHKARMLVNWQEVWRSFPHYSAVEVLSDAEDNRISDKFKNKIVIIGVTWTGATDLGVTPFGIDSPLSRVHSNALNTIMTGNHLIRYSGLTISIIAIICSILFYFAAEKLTILQSGFLSISILILSIGVSFMAFRYNGKDIPLVPFIFLFGLSATATMIFHGISYQSKSIMLSQAMARYLSPQMLQSIRMGSSEIDLATKRKELTILFADIQGFSSVSEHADVEYIESFLNAFFESMTKIIFNNGGTIDKFLGDGLLAFFGEPVAVPNAALSAIIASIEMQRDMELLSSKWASSGIYEFSSGINLRIGVATGMVIIGNIGSTMRMEYTVLGSIVNLASRLQGLAKPGGILINERTYALAGENTKINYGPAYSIKARGFEREVTVRDINP